MTIPQSAINAAARTIGGHRNFDVSANYLALTALEAGAPHLLAPLQRTIASLENENHALREELNETRRDRDQYQAQLEEARHIARLLPAVQEARP